jgi:hypothetical protein
MTGVLALAGGILVTTGLASQQREAIVTGRVIDAVTQRPVDDAEVRLLQRARAGQGGRPTTVQTAADGTFSIAVPRNIGPFGLFAAKAGYNGANLGQQHPRDRAASSVTVELGADGRLSGLEIKIWPTATIAGQVRDERGEPIVGADVTALMRINTAAGPRWQRSAKGRSDDRGRYSMDLRQFGSHLVVARRRPPQGEPVWSVPAVFHPSAREAWQATVIDVAPGEQRVADIELRSVEDVGSLAGQLRGVEDVDGVIVHLAPIGPTGETTEFDERQVTASADRRFRVVDLPQGRYRLTVCVFPEGDARQFTMSGNATAAILHFPPQPGQPLPPLPDAPTWVADMQVSIEPQRETTIDVPLRAGARVSGRVIFDGVNPPAPHALPSIPVLVRPADGGRWGSETIPEPLPHGRIEADGRFTSPGLPPGEYVINVMSGAPGLDGWTTVGIDLAGRSLIGRSFTVGERDVTGMVLTLTDKRTELSGTVTVPVARLVSTARVVVFPADPAAPRTEAGLLMRSLVREIPVDSRGRFAAMLVPGEYLVAAVTSAPPDLSPEFLAALTVRATPVRLSLGEAVTVQLAAR